MVNHSLKEIIDALSHIFPSMIEGDPKNIVYTIMAPNTIKIHHKDKSMKDFIFAYFGRFDYKLMTIECYEREEKSIENLRKKLSFKQTIDYNNKRTERRHNK